MKKLIVVFAFLFAGTKLAQAQIAYYDALKLRSYTNGHVFNTNKPDTVELIGNILLKYFPDSVSVKKAKFKNIFVSHKSLNYNPFLASFFGPGTLGDGPNLFAGASNIVGNTNVGSIVSGLSSFLIKRAKQEVLISIIERLRDSTKFPEFTVLFPRTLSIMNNFDSWQYANVLNTLQSAFDQDLQQMLADLPKLAKLNYDSKLTPPAVKKRVDAMKKFLAEPAGRALTSAMLIGNGFVTNQKVPDVIHNIADTAYLGKVPGIPDASQAIQLLDIISFSLRSNDPGQNYVSTAQIKSLFSDSVSKKIYLGLVYAQIKQRKIVIHGQDVASLIAANADPAIVYALNIVAQGDSLQTAINRWRVGKKNGEKDLTTYWPAIFADGSELLKALGNINQIDPNLQLPTQVNHVFALADSTLSVAQAISQRNYSAVIVELNSLFPGNDKSDFRAFLVKYGSFAANLATAKTSEDAENAIEAVALPVGSYSIKQRGEWNISLNGYLGYGWDFKAGLSHGIYAPVGFSFSHGLSPSGKAGALTAFVSLIDVGSMVSYQINQDSLSNKKQDIRLESIFSPSLQLFYAIPGFPVTVGAGVRRTPKLFYSGDSGFTTIQPRNVFNVSVLFDIPIFTILNKAYK